MRFFYSELRHQLSDDEGTRRRSIFARIPGPKNGESTRPKYRIKEGVEFHLFISSAPCGDGRIFNPHENMNEDGSIDEHPERISRGQLRAKIECGEGTIPVANTANFDGLQTWDEIMHGERLLTMSCSDKVARWNVLGLQGSLLGHFINPVYLKSLVLGSLYHPDHLTRALYGRLESPDLRDSLPPGFRVNRPLLAKISMPEVKQDGKTPSFSVNWTLGDSELEILDTATGKIEGSPSSASRLCKSSFFHRWVDLTEKFDMLYPSSAPDDSGKTAYQEAYYSDLKVMNKEFQSAKRLMFRTLAQRHLGNWVKKPVDQDLFSL